MAASKAKAKSQTSQSAGAKSTTEKSTQPDATNPSEDQAKKDAEAKAAAEAQAKKDADDKAKADAAAKAKKDADDKAKQSVEVLRVSSKGERFRRAGLAFTRDGRDLVLADLTEDQVAALEAEPRLNVQRVTRTADGAEG